MQQSGLVWLYRVVQEPRRLWKRCARNSPLFAYYLPIEKMGLRNFSEPLGYPDGNSLAR